MQNSNCEKLASLALDMCEATKRALVDPATKKPVKFAVRSAASMQRILEGTCYR